MTPSVNRVTTCDTSSNPPTFWNGGSLFNTGGQRLNEIDLDTYRAPKTMVEMTDDDWAEAAAALRAFEIERGIR
jgi:hypothetical protein